MEEMFIFPDLPRNKVESFFSKGDPLIRIPEKKTIDKIINSTELACKEIKKYKVRDHLKDDNSNLVVILSDKILLEKWFMRIFYVFKREVNDYIFKFPGINGEIDYFTVIVRRVYYSGSSDTGNQEILYLGKDNDLIEILKTMGEILYKKKVGFYVPDGIRDYYTKRLNIKI
ncbi:MAG: hypothetical protein KKA61_01785 [Nanoarchaeota archaeon]|nr:hypothetical protein [Nanoarchaeota archaeon]MBU4284344.1 hypothetical protein [Nanoarchaeota archaeon]MBU4493075.1 hypothetical protein [Nanoarchaeota archaeon]